MLGQFFLTEDLQVYKTTTRSHILQKKNKDCSWGCAFFTTSREFGAWQVPFWKLPQVPEGVPKLANLIVDMDSPAAQRKWTLAWWSIFGSPWPSVLKFSIVGWCSDVSAQTRVTDLLTREIFDTSPPSSSKTTNKFCVGFNQDLGTWYLNNT